MTRQGRCLDATQAPVNILDRLEGLSKVDVSDRTPPRSVFAQLIV